MPRITTPKEKYIEEIENMLRNGLSIEDITANKLQKIVGGKYSKISELLDEYKAEYINKINEKNKAPQTVWYQNIVGNITESISNNLGDAWLIINKEILETINKATSEFEYKRKMFETQKQDDSKQIEILEFEIDELKKQISEKDLRLEEFGKLVAGITMSAEKTGEDLSDLKIKNSDLIKSIGVLEGKMQMKDEIIRKLETK